MNSLTVVSSTSDDFIYGNDNHAGLSQRKAAELLKVSNTAIMKVMKSANRFTPEEAESIKTQGFRGREIVKLAGHFAKSSQASKATKDHCVDILTMISLLTAPTYIDLLALENLFSLLPAEKNTKQGFVYFVSPSAHPVVKIGFSSNPEQRIKQIQTSWPAKLTILKTLPRTYETEAQLHRRFAHLQMMGEWFSLTTEILEFLGGRYNTLRAV